MHQLPCFYTEAADTVKLIRIALRWCIAFSLHGSYMEQNRAVQLLRIAQKLRQILDIMPIHRSQVGKAHILKQAARQQTVLDGRFDLVGCMVDVTAQRQYAHDLTVALLRAQVLGLQPLARQMLRHAAHALCDRHAVVVENDDERFPAVPRIGPALIGEPARQGAVADQRQNMIVRML